MGGLSPGGGGKERRGSRGMGVDGGKGGGMGDGGGRLSPLCCRMEGDGGDCRGNGGVGALWEEKRRKKGLFSFRRVAFGIITCVLLFFPSSSLLPIPNPPGTPGARAVLSSNHHPSRGLSELREVHSGRDSHHLEPPPLHVDAHDEEGEGGGGEERVAGAVAR